MGVNFSQLLRGSFGEAQDYARALGSGRVQIAVDILTHIEQKRSYLLRETYLAAGFVPKERQEAGEKFIVEGPQGDKKTVQLFAASDMRPTDTADKRNPEDAVEDLYLQMGLQERRTQMLERPPISQDPVPHKPKGRERDDGPELG